MIERIHPADDRGVVWVTLNHGGQQIDVELDVVSTTDLLRYVMSGRLARDAAPVAVRSVIEGLGGWFSDDDEEDDGWQSEWREKVHGWIRESWTRDKAWLERERQAGFAERADLVARAREWRRAHREIRDWMYEVIDLALGGVDALGIPAAVVVPVFKYAIAGVVATVTVYKVAEFFETDEQKGAEFDEQLITVAEQMLASDDPSVKAKGGEILDTVARTREQRAKNAESGAFGVIVGVGAVLVGLLAWRRRRQLGEAARTAIGRLRR